MDPVRTITTHSATRLSTIGLLAAVFGMIAGCSWSPAGGSPPAAETRSPLNSPLVIAAPTADQTAESRKLTANVATKVAVLATDEARERAPRPTPAPGATRIPTMALPPTPVPRPLPTRLTPHELGGEPAGEGYITVLMDPLMRWDHLSSNTWYRDDPEGLERLTVFAGGVRDGAGRLGPDGDLIVSRYRVDPVTGAITVVETNTLYHSPQTTGMLRITGATGNVLELVSTSGVVFSFHVVTRRFVP